MPRVEISPGKPGTLIVKFEYHAGAVAAIKRVPGRQWNPEGKYWSVPDTPEAHKVVGAIAAMPRDGAGQVIAVAPKSPHPRWHIQQAALRAASMMCHRPPSPRADDKGGGGMCRGGTSR